MGLRMIAPDVHGALGLGNDKYEVAGPGVLARTTLIIFRPHQRWSGAQWSWILSSHGCAVFQAWVPACGEPEPQDFTSAFGLGSCILGVGRFNCCGGLISGFGRSHRGSEGFVRRPQAHGVSHSCLFEAPEDSNFDFLNFDSPRIFSRAEGIFESLPFYRSPNPRRHQTHQTLELRVSCSKPTP